MGLFVALLVCLVLVLVVLPALGCGLARWRAISPNEERKRLLCSLSSPHWAWWRDAGLCFALGVLVLSSVAGCVVARGGSPWVCVVLGGLLGGWLGWQGAGYRELTLPNRQARSKRAIAPCSKKATFYLGIGENKNKKQARQKFGYKVTTVLEGRRDEKERKSSFL